MSSAKENSEKITKLKTTLTISDQKLEELEGNFNRVEYRMRVESEKKAPSINLPALEKRKQECLTEWEEFEA